MKGIRLSLLLIPLFLFFITITVTATRDYVIITTDDYASAFTNLTNWKETRGTWTIRTNLTTHIELLSNITTNTSFWSSGYHSLNATSNTTKDQIRNYLNYSYENHSTQYILLGGNSSVIPTHRVPEELYNVYVRDDVACDLWYTNISGDSAFELFIGRLPCNSSEQVENWTARLEIYENCTNETWANSHIATTANGMNVYHNYFNIANLTTHTYYTRDKSIDISFQPNITSQFFTYFGHGCSTSAYSKRKASLFPNEEFISAGYENLTYPYIHIAAGCKQAQMVDTGNLSHNKFHELLFGGPNLDSNRTAVVCIGTDESTIITTLTPQRIIQNIITASLQPTSNHLGTSIGEAIHACVGGSYVLQYYNSINLFGCPETKPYLSQYNLSGSIDFAFTHSDEADELLYGPSEVVSSSYVDTLSFWLYNRTVTGSASGANFSNYSLQLCWWDNYTTYFVVAFYKGWDINPNSTLFNPPNSLYCFDIPDCNTPVTSGVLGTLNTSMVEYFPRGVYQIKLTVNSTDGRSITKERYFLGQGYLEGIVYNGGVEADIDTPVNVSFLPIDPSDFESATTRETITTYTKNHDGHTGYYNFSFWTYNIKPSQRSPLLLSTVYANTSQSSSYNNYFIVYEEQIDTGFDYYPPTPTPLYMTLDINNNISITNETPTNAVINISITLDNVSVDISTTSGTFNWSIEGSFLTTNNATADSNGTKTATIPLTLTNNTIYIWYVNVTENGASLNRTFSFTTQSPYAVGVCVEYDTDTYDPSDVGYSIFTIIGYFIMISALLAIVIALTKEYM